MLILATHVDERAVVSEDQRPSRKLLLNPGSGSPFSYVSLLHRTVESSSLSIRLQNCVTNYLKESSTCYAADYFQLIVHVFLLSNRHITSSDKTGFSCSHYRHRCACMYHGVSRRAGR